jgi:hypothetical protein
MKTAVIEGRVDIRELATCADYFITQGIPALNKSDLMFRVLTTFAHAAMQQGAKRFESTEEALGYMFEVGLGPVNRVIDRKGRRAGNFALSKAMMEERDGEFTDSIDWEAIARQATEKMERGEIVVDSELDPNIRLARQREEDQIQKDRMNEFLQQQQMRKKV